MEEHHAQVTIGIIRRDDHPAVHVGVAPWLVDQEPAVVVEVGHGPRPAVEHRGALHGAQVDDAERLAGRVVVVGDDHLVGGQHHGREP